LETTESRHRQIYGVTKKKSELKRNYTAGGYPKYAKKVHKYNRFSL